MRTKMRGRGLLATAAMLALAIFTAGPASAATDYVQPVWFTWEKAVLDVLIIPPGHGQIVNGHGVLGGGDLNELSPYENSYIRAAEQAASDWDLAVATFGAAWLKTGLVTNVYVVGRDTIPTAAAFNPEIVITFDEGKTVILGVSVSTRPCLIDNSKFFITSFTYEDMYNISAHEFGHCLGLDHSYGGPPGDQVITHDVIFATYNDTPGVVGNHLHCMSNLNVKGLERVFGGLFGQPSGGSAVMAPSSYQRISC